MSHFIIKNQPLDMVIIDEDNIYELNFWSNELKCDLEELMAAMKEVGNSMKAIRNYFRTV